MSIITRSLFKGLSEKRYVAILRAAQGRLMTSLNMHGMSITILNLSTMSN